MVARSGARRWGCVVIGASLMATRDGCKVMRASPELWGDLGKFEGARDGCEGRIASPGCGVTSFKVARDRYNGRRAS